MPRHSAWPCSPGNVSSPNDRTRSQWQNMEGDVRSHCKRCNTGFMLITASQNWSKPIDWKLNYAEIVPTRLTVLLLSSNASSAEFPWQILTLWKMERMHKIFKSTNMTKDVPSVWTRLNLWKIFSVERAASRESWVLQQMCRRGERLPSPRDFPEWIVRNQINGASLVKHWKAYSLPQLVFVSSI